MNSPRNWLDPGGKLSSRLDQLRDTLESLATRLRESVAEALGKTLGSLVRDTVLGVLDRLTPSAPDSPPTPSWPRRRPLDSESWLEEEDRDGARDHPWSEEDEERQDREPYHHSPAQQQQARRWALALTAGLRAASWLLPSRPTHRAWLAASALALLVCGVGYLAPCLAAAGVTLVGTAHQLGLLTRLLPGLPA